MEGRPAISEDVLARYAADAALEVSGVSGIADGPLHRGGGIVVEGDEADRTIQLRLELEWGRSAAEVGTAVQERVSDYLERMTGARPVSVDVVFDAIGAPPAER